MDTNENTRNEMPEEIIELGTVTSETKGIFLGQEANGGDVMPGLSDQ